MGPNPNQLKISVITVVFNAEKYLESTIESVIGQTNGNYELIIIDGGSKDGTLNIIQKYKPNISYWISEPDKGLYDAMNKGLKAATGDYVWYINAGDKLYDENTLENLIEIAGRTKADILYGETMIIDTEGNPIGKRRLSAPETLNWKSLKRGMLVCHQSFIPKCSIAPQYNLQYKCSSDIDWEINCLKKAAIIVNTKLYLSQFLDGGRSKKTILPSLRERFTIMQKHYGLVTTLFNHMSIPLRFIAYYLRYRRF